VGQDAGDGTDAVRLRGVTFDTDQPLEQPEELSAPGVDRVPRAAGGLSQIVRQSR
jgi:hypothetical protein